MKNWYNRLDVKFQMIRYLYNRETALIVPSFIDDPLLQKRSTRMLKCHSVQHLTYILEKGLRVFRGLDNHKEMSTPFNLYYSLAKYVNGIPNQTFNMRDKKDINSGWNINHYKEMLCYDYLIDIDAGSHEDMDMAFYSAKAIVDFFDETNCPYELRFSGKGYHILIPHRYLPNLSFYWKDKNSLYKFLASVSKKLSERFSEMIDIGIYDSRRVCKIPYSLALYEENTYVCFPFSSLQEFTSISFADLLLEAFCLDIRNRKRKVFNSEGSIYRMLDNLRVKDGI